MKLRPKQLVIGVAGLVAFSIVMSVIPPPGTSQDWAAWVQGIGTIVAVGVAGWVGMLPLQMERDRERARLARLTQNVEHAVKRAVNGLAGVREIIEKADAPDDFERYTTALQRELTPLSTLQLMIEQPPMEWPSAEVHDTAIQLHSALTQLYGFDTVRLRGPPGGLARLGWKAAHWNLERIDALYAHITTQLTQISTRRLG